MKIGHLFEIFLFINYTLKLNKLLADIKHTKTLFI